jgi:hypothetical protein
MKNIHHKKINDYVWQWKITVEILIIETLSVRGNYETME